LPAAYICEAELDMDWIGLGCIWWDDRGPIFISNHCRTIDAVSFKLWLMNSAILVYHD